MQQLIHDLQVQVPSAVLTGREDAAPIPDWWPGPDVGHLPAVYKVSGMPIDVNSMDRGWMSGGSFELDGPVCLTGGWRDELDTQAASLPPEGWQDQGVEVLAWYSSFHYCSYAWGIFIRQSGVERVAAALQSNTGCTVDEAFIGAWTFLYEHELTHFKVDLLITEAEFASRTALFVPGRKRQAAHPGSALKEEALATALGRRALPIALRTGLDPWLDQLPPGYREWRSARNRATWGQAIGEAIRGEGLPVIWTPPGGRPPFEADVPVFLALDSEVSAENLKMAFVGPISGIIESPSFRKDLRRLAKGDPRVPGLWSRRKDRLAEGLLAAGSHLELIDRRHRRYSTKIDASRRAALELSEDARWVAIAADEHDALYRRLTRMP